MALQPVQIDEILALYQADPNVTLKEIGAAYGVSDERIRQLVIEHNVPRRAANRPSDSSRREALRLYAETTISLTTIAEAFGYSASNLAEMARLAGLPARGRGYRHTAAGHFDTSGEVPVWVPDETQSPRRPSGRPGKPAPALTKKEQAVLKLYRDTGIPIKSILWAYEMPGKDFDRLMARTRTPTRDEVDGTHPREVWDGTFEISSFKSPVWRPRTEIVSAPAGPEVQAAARPIVTNGLATLESPVQYVVKHVPVPARLARQPAREVEFVLTYTTASQVRARTPDEAIARLREALGPDVEITSVIRAE